MNKWRVVTQMNLKQSQELDDDQLKQSMRTVIGTDSINDENIKKYIKVSQKEILKELEEDGEYGEISDFSFHVDKIVDSTSPA